MHALLVSCVVYFYVPRVSTLALFIHYYTAGNISLRICILQMFTGAFSILTITASKTISIPEALEHTHQIMGSALFLEIGSMHNSL